MAIDEAAAERAKNIRERIQAQARPLCPVCQHPMLMRTRGGDAEAGRVAQAFAAMRGEGRIWYVTTEEAEESLRERLSTLNGEAL